MNLTLKENIKELNENLTAFPEAESIFVKEQAWLKEHLLPLISIDLGELNSHWQGTKVHLLNPIEPYEGYIGEQTSEYHNEFTAMNWLAFRLNEQNQYEFLGNEGYFLRSPLHEQSWDEDEQEHFAEMVEIYNESKAQVAKDGYLIFPRSEPFKGKPNITNFLDRLGGGTWYGNWTESAEMPSAFEMKLPPVGTTYDEMEQMLNSGIEISYNGNPFYFIADVSGYNYCDGADAIILFYEPVSRIVLFTFDWS
ncbi:MAG: hypothetical protein Q4B95_05275 [Lonepinella koalarum]|nr:hypothetical protein [Lonepinella koalarum]